MLTKSNFPLLQWGQLYIYTKEFPIISTYTLDPYSSNFSAPIISSNLNDLLTFLNMNELNLITYSHQLLSNILNDCDYKEDLVKVVTELTSLHTFFKQGTSFHICDFLIHYTLDTVLKEVHLTDNQNSGERLLINRINKICSAIIDNTINDSLEYITQIYVDIYTKLYKELYFFKHTSMGKPTIYDDLFSLRNFIINNLPEKVPRLNQINWQNFIVSLNNNYSSCKRLSSLSITNHINYVYHSDEVNQNTLPPNIYLDIIEKYPPYDSVKFEKMLRASQKESNYTYLIESFEDYIIADITSLFNSTCSIKFCPNCGNYYLYHCGLAEHNCEKSSLQDKYIKDLTKLYTDKLNSQTHRYSLNHTNLLEKENIAKPSKKHKYNPDAIEIQFEAFKNFHLNTFRYAIKNHIGVNVYNDYLNSPDYKFQNDKFRLLIPISDYHN